MEVTPDAAARADEVLASLLPTRAYNKDAIRRLSILSLCIPPALKGVSYVMDLSKPEQSAIGRLVVRGCLCIGAAACAFARGCM